MAKLLHPDDIDPDNPFSHETDVLARSKCAEVLSSIISTISEPYVIAVDAGWGSGKTIFLTQWMHQLRNDGFQCVYFNAWESDFVDDPLIAFISEVQAELISSRTDGDTPPTNDHLDRLKTVLPKLMRAGAIMGTRALTAGVLDLRDAGVEGALADGAADMADQLINSYHDTKDVMEQFREELQQWIASKQETDGNQAKPIVFIVDELDRCRPTYAIALLERIKHLFNVKGIVFALGMDKEQLGHSVRSVYGADMDADGYLRRFIDLEYRLPDPSSKDYSDYILTKHSIPELLIDERPLNKQEQHQWLIRTLSIFKEIFNLSLRDCEKIVARLELVFRANTRAAKTYLGPLAIALICIRTKNFELYQKYRKQQPGAGNITTQISKTDNQKKFFESEPPGIMILVFLDLGFCDWSSATDELQSVSGTDPDLESRIRADALRILSNSTSRPYMEFIFEQIEMSADFAL